MGNTTHSYRPQMKLEQGYVFTRVCDSVHSGGGGIQACIAGGIPACLAAGLQGGYPSMPCRYPGPHPGGKLRGLSWAVSRPTPGGWIPACTEADTTPPPDGYCCRWYTSYWNVFLLNFSVYTKVDHLVQYNPLFSE